MIRTRHLLLIFLPAILIAGIALAVRVTQFQSLYPKDTPEEDSDTSQNGVPIPILPSDPIIGERGAPITIITFEDFGCPACRDQINLLDTLRGRYPKKIKIIWKGLAVTRIPYPSRLAHEYAFCANRQGKFAPFAAKAFDSIANLSPGSLESIATAIPLNEAALAPCLAGDDVKNAMKQTEQIAELFHIQSVPTIFVNNKQVEPPRGVEGWVTLLGLK
ncbi:MAG: thioredoxin domain-containing protein [Candidatus Magasanikbacteria bacterium]|nr:thioredoxin domain-containing protein [Candidatus Magasanikbacteria bacterium]